MKSFLDSISIIPDDILLEIFKLLPFETLHKIKWASRSWHSLITRHLFPKIIQTQFLGFFFQSIGNPTDTFAYIEKDTINDRIDAIFIDPELYLACCASTQGIIDCCHGLILYEAWKAETYYVCNPVTESWTVVMGCGFIPDHTLLDFDPWVSPYFRLVAFAVHPSTILVSMYCSGTKRWVQKRIVECRVYAWPSPRRHHCTLWNRALYVHGVLTRSPANDDAMFEEGYKTIRFVLSEGDVGFKIVEFPTGTKMPSDGTWIGRLGDKLCFAGLDGLRLRVWILSSKHDNRWVRVHKGCICSPRGLERYVPLPQIVGFHPLRSAVLFFYGRAIFAYDLVEMSFVEICQIGSEERYSTRESVFPFLTCSLTLLENRSETKARKQQHGLAYALNKIYVPPFSQQNWSSW